jgi:hypothetical protein
LRIQRIVKTENLGVRRRSFILLAISILTRLLAKMGNLIQHPGNYRTQLQFERNAKPETSPDISHPPTFDPNYGFSEPRKVSCIHLANSVNVLQERKMIATEDEMDAAKVPINYRDYCAHKYIAFHVRFFHVLCI